MILRGCTLGLTSGLEDTLLTCGGYFLALTPDSCDASIFVIATSGASF